MKTCDMLSNHFATLNQSLNIDSNIKESVLNGLNSSGIRFKYIIVKEYLLDQQMHSAKLAAHGNNTHIRTHDL